MKPVINKDVVLEENKLLIDMTVSSVCNGKISASLESYLLLAITEGWQDLVAAIRLILDGEREVQAFSKLDEEDTIVINKTLELLNSPDVVVKSLLLTAQQNLYKSTEEAYKQIETAVELSPENPLAHAMMGQVLHVKNRLEESAESYEKSLLLADGQPLVWLNLGVVLSDLKRFMDSIKAFEKVLSMQPENLDAISHLAYLYERSYLLEDAKDAIEKGLSIKSDQSVLTFVNAKLQQRSNNSTEAIELIKRSLEIGLPDNLISEAYSRLGYLYDSFGETQQAIDNFSEANLIYEKKCRSRGVDKNTFYVEAKQLKRYSEGVASINFDENTDPVFLIGFPRSGTTLLNQILDSHGMIKTLEEKPLVASMINKLYEFSKSKGHNDFFLSQSEVQELRKVYFDSVCKYISIKDEVFIDKFPLNIVYIPLLMKIFPKARYILALRHPCDVCLSCFMHSFGINSAMCNFSNMQDTISLYVKLMTDWEVISKEGNLKFHRIRYEDIVENFQHETQRLLDFLDLDWDDDVNSHTEKARARGVIDTPSYDQVTKPLYKHAIYRWQKYQSLFDEYMLELESLIKEYDY